MTIGNFRIKHWWLSRFWYGPHKLSDGWAFDFLWLTFIYCYNGWNKKK